MRRFRNWWDSDRIYDYLPWDRRRPNTRPNSARHWPSYHCNLICDTELSVILLNCVMEICCFLFRFN